MKKNYIISKYDYDYMIWYDYNMCLMKETQLEHIVNFCIEQSPCSTIS